MLTRAFAIRILTALIMGVILVLLSALLHRAVASSVGGDGSYLWATWLVAIVVTLLIAFGAPNGRIALGRLCLINGVVSGLLLGSLLMPRAAGATLGDLGDLEGLMGLARPKGAALGAALLSAALGIIAVAFLLVSYLLLRLRSHRQERSMQT